MARRKSLAGPIPLLAWLAWTIAALLATPALAAPKRVALVVGNSAYQEAPLKNPVNDARAMGSALRDLGFEVIERTDATQREFNRAVTAFGEKLSADSIALVFYAGHGIQVRGKNYLIPVDARISSEASIRSEAIDVDVILEQVATTGSGLNFVILDACRNNPFERRFRSSAGSGLAQMDAPKGTFIAYATAPGKTASDGDGDNGLYTQELLKAITAPGMKVEDVFKKVRIEVARLSNDYQLPWESSSLTGDFYFKAPLPAKPQATGPDAATLELELWKSAQQLDATDAYRAYLDAYPQGRYARLAQIGIAKIEQEAAKRQAAESALQVALSEATARLKAAEDAARLAAAEAQQARIQSLQQSETAQRQEEADRAREAAEAELAVQLAATKAAGEQSKNLTFGVPRGEASLSPTLLASAQSSLANLGRILTGPNEGDQWTYRFVDNFKRQAVGDFRVRLESVNAQAIKERYEHVSDVGISFGAPILRGRWIDTTQVEKEISFMVLPNPDFPAATPRKIGDANKIIEWMPYRTIDGLAKQGREWDGPFQINGRPCAGSAEVDGTETVTVPAGTFQAVRVDLICNGDIFNHDSGRYAVDLSLKVWFAEHLYRPIKIEKKVSAYNRTRDWDSIELVRFER